MNGALKKGESMGKNFPGYIMVSVIMGMRKRDIPRMMTLVVPSPTSSSWVLESSIMFFAAG
jgi:hypothetical protein